jgi:hypothetical protein
MTLQASGSMDFDDITFELGITTLPITPAETIPSDENRWLAEKDTGNVVVPTDFYSKSCIKEQVYRSLSARTSHVYSGVTLGSSYGSRGIIIVIGLYGKTAGNAPSTASISNMNIFGTVVGNRSPTQTSVVPDTTYCGLDMIVSGYSGTSGTISFSTEDTTASTINVYTYSKVGWTLNSSGDIGFGTGGSVLVNGTNSGMQIAAAIKANENDMTWTNVIERIEDTPFTGYRLGVAWTTGLTGVAAHPEFTSSSPALWAIKGMSR